MKDKLLQKLEEIAGGKLTLGKTLQSIRKCDDMSEKEFADKLGTSEHNLRDIERGYAFVAPGTAVHYARRLKHCEKLFVCLALQDMLDRDGVEMTVEIK